MIQLRKPDWRCTYVKRFMDRLYYDMICMIDIMCICSSVYIETTLTVISALIVQTQLASTAISGKINNVCHITEPAASFMQAASQ